MPNENRYEVGGLSRVASTAVRTHANSQTVRTLTVTTDKQICVFVAAQTLNGVTRNSVLSISVQSLSFYISCLNVYETDS